MLRKYRQALQFLLKYVILYLSLNTLYALFINHYSPAPDLLTVAVTKQSAALLSLIEDNVGFSRPSDRPYLPITQHGVTVVEVYEGCNSINVIVVYISFIVAYRGSWRRFLIFFVGGIVAIYLLNLLRVIGLFGVALHFPDSLYFFHKFVFTGMLYGFVFLSWYYWMKPTTDQAK